MSLAEDFLTLASLMRDFEQRLRPTKEKFRTLGPGSYNGVTVYKRRVHQVRAHTRRATIVVRRSRNK